jgi:hypothetical protein
MTKSESIKELAAALVKAQAKIEGATKDKTNPHFKSKYADLSSVVEAIKKPATDNGLTWTQVMHPAENAAAVETIIMHSSGEWLSCGVISVPVSKQDAQGYGSALTYARRYSLSAAFGVAPEDDDGNAASAAAPKSNGSKVTPNAGALDNLTPEERAAAIRLGAKVVELWGSGKEIAAYEQVYEAGHSNEFILGLWEVLQPQSTLRSALKKMHRENQLAQTA